MTDGTWDVAEGVVDRWSAGGLDEAFIAEWEDATLSARYSPLCDTEAVDGVPKPYCVFEQSESQTRTTQSKSTTRLAVLVGMTLQFTIHAKTKPQAVAMAKLVSDAFDNAQFGAGGTCVIGMARLADYGARDGATGWLWVLRYGIIQDAEQAINN